MNDEGLPRLVARHPLGWGLASGVVMALVGLGLFGSWLLAVVVAAPFGAANWLVWRKDGPAHRWRAYVLARYPKKGAARDATDR